LIEFGNVKKEKLKELKANQMAIPDWAKK